MRAPRPGECAAPINRVVGGPVGARAKPCPAAPTGGPVVVMHRATARPVEVELCAAHRAALMANSRFRSSAAFAVTAPAVAADVTKVQSKRETGARRGAKKGKRR